MAMAPFEHRNLPDVDRVRIEDGHIFTLSDLKQFDPVHPLLKEICEEEREGRAAAPDRAAMDALRVRELVQPELYGLVDRWHQREI